MSIRARLRKYIEDIRRASPEVFAPETLEAVLRFNTHFDELDDEYQEVLMGYVRTIIENPDYQDGLRDDINNVIASIYHQSESEEDEEDEEDSYHSGSEGSTSDED